VANNGAGSLGSSPSRSPLHANSDQVGIVSVNAFQRGVQVVLKLRPACGRQHNARHQGNADQAEPIDQAISFVLAQRDPAR
jgi:hypothetical protein